MMHADAQLDLDTIETSNLNRQFLFRRRHVGESKSRVACAAAMEMVRAVQGKAGASPSAAAAPGASASGTATHVEGDVTIVSHHANIKDGQYDVDFFKGFDIVLNGLDNVEARRHVNRCGPSPCGAGGLGPGALPRR